MVENVSIAMPFEQKKRETFPPSTKNPSMLLDIFQFLLLISFLSWLFFKSSGQLGYNWQWYRIWQYLIRFDETGIHGGVLFDGLGVTLKICFVSMLLSLVIGLVTAFFRISNSPLARLSARIYLELIRNTPLLIQIFFIYFVLGPILGLERFSAAIVALSLFEGAYVSEIFRSGLLSIDKGQLEAGYSIGFSTYLNYRHIVLPQAVRITLPPLTNQMISLIKDSALVSTIAIYDLTMEAQNIIAETFLTFEIWFAVALIYLLFTVSLSWVAVYLEKRVTYAQ